MTVIDVTQYEAKGDGVTSDFQAFSNALASNPGKSIYVPDPSVAYVIDNTLTIPNNSTLYGQSKFSTKIIKVGNLDFANLGDGSSIKDLWIDGQGASNTSGRGIVIGNISNTDGKQNVLNSRIINFPQDCVAYTNVNAGSQSVFMNCEFNQYGAAPGSNRYAVTIADSQQLAAVPRTFIGCEFQGTPSFNFGGCNDVFISGCFLGDLNYTLNSRGVQIANSRVSNQSILQIYGHNHTIVGSDINPQIIVTPGVDNCHIGPNSLNHSPIVDNSGNGRNQLYQWSTLYTPVISSGGTQPSLGNGILNGKWSRQGNTVFVQIEFTIGSTTNLGTGDIRFSLPPCAPNNCDINQSTGTVHTYHSSNNTNNLGVCLIPSMTQYLTMIRDTTSSITYNSPQSWVPGDAFHLSFSYSVGS